MLQLVQLIRLLKRFQRRSLDRFFMRPVRGLLLEFLPVEKAIVVRIEQQLGNTNVLASNSKGACDPAAAALLCEVFGINCCDQAVVPEARNAILSRRGRPRAEQQLRRLLVACVDLIFESMSCALLRTPPMRSADSRARYGTVGTKFVQEHGNRLLSC